MTSLPELIQQSRRQLLATATERGVDLRPHLQQDELVQTIATHMMARLSDSSARNTAAMKPWKAAWYSRCRRGGNGAARTSPNEKIAVPRPTMAATSTSGVPSASARSQPVPGAAA